MARNDNKKGKDKRDPAVLVEFKRHIGLPIRRAPGQRVWLTGEQICSQGLRKGDYVIIKT